MNSCESQVNFIFHLNINYSAHVCAYNQTQTNIDVLNTI